MLEIEILQVALGRRDELSSVPTAVEWQKIYQFAEQQALVGVLFGGIEKLPKHQLPDKDLLIAWFGQTEYLKVGKRQIHADLKLVDEVFKRAGYRTCLLKGIGNELFYDDLIRTSGDIDLWVMPEGVNNMDKARPMTQKFVQSIYPDARGEFVHMDWPWKGQTMVEIHFVLTMDGNPSIDRKLKRFFEDNAEACFCNMTSIGVSVPTKVVNGVFLLHHMKRHFIQEGIGMRHVVDYALFLKSLSPEEREQLLPLIKRFGMMNFAAALMTLMLRLGFDFGWPTDSRRGAYLYREILIGGNFGHHDSRQGDTTNAYARWKWFVSVALNRVRFFPSDAFWTFICRLKIGFSNVKNK